MSNLSDMIWRNPLLHRIVIGTAWHGVYPSFAAAMAAIPAGKQAGYNNAGGAQAAGWNMVNYRRPTNYAAYFHMRPLLKPGMRIFDFGGANGIAYYASREYMQFPAGLEWTVCDVKKVIEAGEQIAIENDTEGLRFTEDFEQCNHSDLMVSSGALQYVEAGIADKLATLVDPPSYIIINRIPVWDREPLFTLQTIDSIMCPYQVFNRDQFQRSIERLGYRLMDEWECPESTFSVRFRPALRLDAYHGFYFALPAQPVESVFRPADTQWEAGMGSSEHKQPDLAEAGLSCGGR